MAGILDAEVLIAGAGPAGLALGLALTRLGVDALVVDAAPEPIAEPRAAVVWPREAELLAAVGLGPALRAASTPLETTGLFMGRRRLGALRFGANDSAFPCPLLIEQHVLQHLMLAEIERRGGRVLWRTALVDFEPRQDRVQATLTAQDGSTIAASAAWLVGCDGARSQVRKRLGVAFDGSPARNLEVVQVKARLDWPYEPREGALFLAANHALGSFPMPGGQRRFYCFKTIDEPQRSSAPSLPEMEALIGRMMGGAPVALRDADWLSRARFQRRIAAHMRVGRVLLAGDAAHVWPAVGGHGMAMAVQDACNLAWRLAAVVGQRGPETLLDVYGREQRAQATALIARMELDLLERPLPGALAAGLGLILPGLLKLEGAQSAVELMLSDLTLHRRASPMSVSAGGGGRPRPGDRVPNVNVLSAGATRRLHELLTVDAWTLLVPMQADLATLDPVLRRAGQLRIARIEPADAAARAALGAMRRLLLVRPDGVIGLNARTGDAGALGGYISAWLGPCGPIPRAKAQEPMALQSVPAE